MDLETWQAIGGTATIVAIGLVLIRLGRLWQVLSDLIKIEHESQIRNCAHHGILFDAMGISRDAVIQAERDAGVENPGVKP